MFAEALCPYCGGEIVHEVIVFREFENVNAGVLIKRSWKKEEFLKKIMETFASKIKGKKSISLDELENIIISSGIRGEIVYDIIERIKLEFGMFERNGMLMFA